MPLRGAGHSRLVTDEEPYFKSLAELDAWFAQPHDKLLGVLPYQPRPHTDGQSDGRGRLMVCHDYRGGYTESPSGLCYTFNFWSFCDTFIYFSHNRVTVPPSTWSNAAHRQGTKMLGTLIFEHSESQPECLQIIVGQAQSNTSTTIPLSKRYAILLAELAYQRGFDGYLLNFEYKLESGIEQARALAAWIVLLRAELRAKVGPHAQAVWYDSVIYDGRLRWQNRLNSYNLPFFLASDALFVNYFWAPEYPTLTAQYFTNLDPAIVAGNAIPPFQAKTLQSIFTGTDVWGRGQYGGGGFGSYRALTRIDPEFLGLSAAVFGPAWTWESEEGKPGWNWDQWWDYERKLWVGPPRSGDIVPVPDAPEGLFKPMTQFFQDLPPPDPAKFAFYTFFSPGVGHAWFVDGKKVLDVEKGWTDIDKQRSIGNLVWPRPCPVWEGDERADDVPTASSSLDMTDGYNGGNTLKLSITCAESAAEDAFFKCIWLPVQSLTVTSGKAYEACIICKTTADEGVYLDFSICAKSLSEDASSNVDLVVRQAIVSDLPQGWSQQTLEFSAPSAQCSASVAIGLVIGIVTEDPTIACNLSISLGQLAVYPSPPRLLPTLSLGTPSILWAKFARALTPSKAFEGVLTWDTSSDFLPIDVAIGSPEDPNPAWILNDTPAYRFPIFAYFNIYVVPLNGNNQSVDRGSAVFIGTTGLDGRANRFYVEEQCLPEGFGEHKGVRFCVQGVTDRGQVLPLERCAVVDYWKGRAC
ncbi:glycoside hydrolase family 85 protein [Paxillus rubicundulus Ve08.2h10]|uniref:Glycoside hydrolase family 85 protein n=1 Tax=Paxillus rubicundulus Ve08.2h10 TaxID=930991 RepID=A0A0D0E5K1_9AGAM|nr:glycoside hydrolase family 85 protein [Paxillus rubicundulus Ve08.2h10]